MTDRSRYINSALYFLFFLIALIVYWQTKFPSMTWWGNPAYGVVCSDLGVENPPGSLIATLLGWPFMKLAGSHNPIAILNAVSGIIAAIVMVLVVGISAMLIRLTTSSIKKVTSKDLTLPIVATGIACLTLSFDPTIWYHANQYNVYIITALFTALIILLALKWWEQARYDAAFKWIFLIFLFIGIDFGVHRTNLLLMPGILIMIIIRRPRTYLEIKSWLMGLAGLVLGLSTLFLFMPMAAANPFLNSNDPSNLQNLWNYISLKQIGGGFLVNLYPRKAPLFSYQTVDYFRAIGRGFVHWSGWLTGVGILPLFLAIYGLIRLWIKNSRLALSLILLWLTYTIATITYFNIPADFFRSLWRHYLPGLVILTIFLGFGAADIMDRIRKLSSSQKISAALVTLLVLVWLPLNNFQTYLSDRDASDNYRTVDYARNMLDNLPPHSVLFTFGDNDTYPLWYLQVAENFRSDVAVISTPLSNTFWYAGQIIRRNPQFELGISDEELSNWGIKRWQDTTITLKIKASSAALGLPDSVTVPEQVAWQVPPSIADHYIMGQELMILKFVEALQWNFPIYFSAAGIGNLPAWLQSHIRIEGLVGRLLPIENPPQNMAIMQENLLRNYKYRGFKTGTKDLAWVDQNIAQNYISSLANLASIMANSGDKEGLATVLDKIDNNFSEDLMNSISPQMLEAIKQLREYSRTKNDLDSGDNGS